MAWATMPVWSTEPPNNGCLPARHWAVKASFAGLQPSLNCTSLVCFISHTGFCVCVSVCVCVFVFAEGGFVWYELRAFGWQAGGSFSVALWAYRGWPNTLVPSYLAPTSPWIVYCASVCSYNSALMSVSGTLSSQALCVVSTSKLKSSH